MTAPLRRRQLVVGLGPALIVAGIGARAHAGSWDLVTREAGITVTKREVDGRDLPTFRGVGIVKAGVHEVLAVLTDVRRHPEWMHKCSAARILRRRSSTVRYVYNRTDAPWPISDRDVGLGTEIVVKKLHEEIHTFFRAESTRLMGKVEGVVRMPRLEGHYKMKRVSEGRTRVDYQVDADPGGRIPTWIARIATKDLPLRTLKNLRKQIARTRGEYEDVLDEWSVLNPD